MQWFTTPERYYEAAKVIFEGQLAHNVRYVETSFHAGMIQFIDIPGPEILAAIRSAVPAGMEVRVFMGMARNSYNEVLAPVLEECVHWDGLAGTRSTWRRIFTFGRVDAEAVGQGSGCGLGDEGARR